MNRKLHPLNTGWKLLGTPPGAFAGPGSLTKESLTWKDAVVPGTVAQSLGIRVDDVETAESLDSKDWWYRCSFSSQSGQPGRGHRLRFDGLATVATVWLDGKEILNARNMFLSHSCDVTDALKTQGPHELVILFRSLDAELSIKRKRPRWKTALVGKDQQSLRWVRTTLLGRIPGWTPPIAPVGPWKQIALESFDGLDLTHLSVRTELRGNVPHVLLEGELLGAKTEELREASLVFGGKSYPLKLAGGSRIALDAVVEKPELWWPHTHGVPHLSECKLRLKSKSDELLVDCGPVGFKTVSMETSGGRAVLHLNGTPIFCRGACWTTDDFVSLNRDEKHLKETLLLAQRAGVNLLRVGGTMIYESDDFYRLCDEYGILVWQDFMFANMDYPVSDPEFHEQITQEARQQVKRLAKHSCIAVYCGGSEVQQQAAMLGLPASEWSNEFFDRELPELCSKLHPGIPYFPSTPCGGVLPFHVSTGISHYYGVGAYRKPLTHLKHAKVAFTPECLGFSNVPEPPMLLRRDRVPRDSGTDWDFQDVRDHYFKELFGIDPASLRGSDPGRYDELSRVVTGEVMKTAYAEWRKPGSGCGGALVWFFKDLWPGAGWGIIDSLGRPKAVYHYLKRAWAPKAVLITDEGLDGLQLHVFNDSDQTLSAVLGMEVFKLGKVRTATAEAPVEISANGAKTILGDGLLGYFTDLTYSYKFGPPQHDVVRAYLKSSTDGRLLSEDFFFPGGLNLQGQSVKDVEVSVEPVGKGKMRLRISSACFLQNVHFSVPGYQADDSYFHLAPGQKREVLFEQVSADAPEFKAEVLALNLPESVAALKGGARE